MTSANFLEYLNYETVLLFGIFVSVSFAGVKVNRKNIGAILLFCSVTTLVQFGLFLLLGKETTAKLYPFFVHLPLILFLVYVTKVPPLMAASAVFGAYLCCQTRRWFGSLFLFIFDDTRFLFLAQILVTLPLYVLLATYFAGPVQRLMQQSKRAQFLFGIVPFFYYCFDYITTIYSDILYKGSKVAVEFMPTILSIGYFVFVLLIAADLQKQSKAKEDQLLLEMQIGHATKELAALRESQIQAAIYRHDLRHHLRYLESHLQSGEVNIAIDYIRKLDHNIESGAIKRYCENETVNLILSSYASLANLSGIRFETKVALDSSALELLSSVEYCIILGNLLENAIEASKQVNQDPFIYIEAKQQKGKVFCQVKNSYSGTVQFEGKYPVTTKAGHGMGIKSIVMTVEKLKGFVEFSVENNIFIAQFMI
jgi:signal transduction histidine kinase